MLEVISPNHYRLHGRLDINNNAELLKDLLAVIDDKKSTLNQLQLDVSELQSADSVLLAVIIHIARAVEAQNGVLRIVGFPVKLHGLAVTYGIDALIERYMVIA